MPTEATLHAKLTMTLRRGQVFRHDLPGAGGMGDRAEPRPGAGGEGSARRSGHDRGRGPRLRRGRARRPAGDRSSPPPKHCGRETASIADKPLPAVARGSPPHDFADRHRYRRHFHRPGRHHRRRPRARRTRSPPRRTTMAKASSTGCSALLADGRHRHRGAARHDRRLEHRAGGQGRAHRADHHARLPRHPGNPRPAHAGAVRPCAGPSRARWWNAACGWR